MHGWGGYGLNLALAWAGDAGVEAATDFELTRQPITLNAVLLAALGNDLQPQPMPRCFPIAAKAAAIWSRWKPGPVVCL